MTVKNLSVIILTKDEEANLPVCLKSLACLETEIFIVDSGSADRTLEIARDAGCLTYQHPFVSQAAQLNWALENLPFVTPWIMRLDADERLTDELANELRSVLPLAPETVTGFQMKRKVYFMGRWIRYGGYYPTWLLRIWRKGFGICEDRRMDEHMTLKKGKIEKLEHDLIDENQKNLAFWIDKHNRYAEREMKELQANVSSPESFVTTGGHSFEVRMRRWLKINFYGQAPLFFRSAAYFLLRYILLLGFLDGKEGLIFHFLQGFWYRFLIDAKLYEASLETRKKR